MTQYEFSIERTLISITILGESTVGKTQLCNYFVNKKFEQNNMFTIGFDLKVVNYKLKNGQTIKVKIWDTAGQEKYRNMALQYIKNTNGVIFAYDIKKKESFNRLITWINTVKNKINLEEIPFTIFGNKSDLNNERIVSTEEGEKFAKKLSCSFFETSAKFGTNVENAFDDIINQIYENIKDEFKNEEKVHSKSFYLKNDKKKNNKCCNKEK